jgi:ribonuclease HII
MARKKSILDLPEKPQIEHEQALWKRQFSYIAGLDEAGRGAWAGPVAAGAVILPQKNNFPELLSGVRDSKQMTARQRDHWAKIIQSVALSWSVAFASHEEIDRLGIIAATRLAMECAIKLLSLFPEHLLIDALKLPQVQLPQTDLIKGDRRSLSIAAASILAKTGRDALMIGQERDYPGYGFARHKGYGTRIHQQAIKDLGPCFIHRRSFKPIRETMPGSEELCSETSS